MDDGPLEEGCGCPACRRFSRGYVRHLLNVGEMLGARLTATHNLWAYLDFVSRMKDSIRKGTFSAFREETARAYGPGAGRPNNGSCGA